jgi:hypothetical protein
LTLGTPLLTGVRPETTETFDQAFAGIPYAQIASLNETLDCLRLSADDPNSTRRAAWNKLRIMRPFVSTKAAICEEHAAVLTHFASRAMRANDDETLRSFAMDVETGGMAGEQAAT